MNCSLAVLWSCLPKRVLAWKLKTGLFPIEFRYDVYIYHCMYTLVPLSMYIYINTHIIIIHNDHIICIYTYTHNYYVNTIYIWISSSYFWSKHTYIIEISKLTMGTPKSSKPLHHPWLPGPIACSETWYSGTWTRRTEVKQCDNHWNKQVWLEEFLESIIFRNDFIVIHAV